MQLVANVLSVPVVATRRNSRKSRSAVRCHAVNTPSCTCGTCGAAPCACQTRRGVLSAALVAVPFFASPLAAYAMPSPTNVDDMEERKNKREEVLKAARAKAEAQAAAAAAPAAPPPPAAE